MISTRDLKKIAKKYEKRISRRAIEKIGLIFKEKADRILKKAGRNADFAGRKTIKEEDLENLE